MYFFFFFSSRRRHTRWPRDWSSDVCSSDLAGQAQILAVNNAELKGDYAFNFTGFSASSTGSSVFSAGGRFRADGAGNLTRSEERRVGKEGRGREGWSH